MLEQEAREIIKKHVLENFDSRWHTEPLFFKEYHAFFEFGINSKKYIESGNFKHSFTSLGFTYISKKYGDIVHYGSALPSFYSIRFFLLTEYRLNIVRSKYEIGRADYNYKLVIKDITDLVKAKNYIKGIFIYKGSQYVEKKLSGKDLEIPSVDYFSLLNFLYFNVIDQFCECSYQKIITEFDLSKPLRSFECFNQFESSDRLFYKHIEEKVIQSYPLFEINKNYSVSIIKIINYNKFNQYFETIRFKYYGKDEQTGYEGYISYSNDEVIKIMKKDKKSFDFIEGNELLFFLFANTLESFCKIDVEKILSD